MSKSVVSIVKGTDAEKMVEEALSLLGGVSSLIKPDSTVVIKPNAIGGFPPERGADTSPAIISAVIKELHKAKPKKIIMAEAAGGGTRSTITCMETNGQKKAAEDAGVDDIIDIKEAKDLIKIPIRDRRSTLESVLLPKFLVEADHIVNLPIFKTHVSMTFTCALKNMKGIVQAPVQFQMHTQTVLADSMLDLWSICKADLQIVDMIRPTEGYGPLCGIPTDFGCVVAGKDPVAVDATCCRMAGLDMSKVPFWKQAKERAIGSYEEKDIEIRGKQIKEVFKQLWIPYLEPIDRYPEYNIISKGACALCESLVVYGLDRLKALGDYDKNAGMTIVLGSEAEPPEGVNPRDLIIFGKCVPEKFRDRGIYIEGCPPAEDEPTESILDRSYDGFAKKMERYWKETAFFIEYLKKKRAEKTGP